MEITIDNKITCENVPSDLLAELKNRLSFQNPKFLENDRLGYSNWNVPRILKYYEMDNSNLILPRGYARSLLPLCTKYGITYTIMDARRTLDSVNFKFNGTLRRYQEIAVTAMLRRDFGVLSSPTGSGKTTMCLYCIAERRQPALIVVHTKELLNQWIDRIETFLGISAEQVGVIGNGKRNLGNRITVALIQSLYKCANEIKPYVGFLIVDECHRTPSRTFTEAVTAFDSKYMLGLSATPWRRDKLNRLINWALGDQIHKIEKDDLIETGDILQAEVIVKETNFDTLIDASKEYSKVLSELSQDHERNLLIVQDVIKESNNGGGICLILSDRKKHCEAIRQLLYVHGVRAELLTGDISNKDREAIIERLNQGLAKVLIATGQLIGEGFDCPGLSTLFLVTPVRFSGRVLQYLGRVLRSAPGKGKAKVYDYVDSRVGVLRASGEARQRVYRSCFERRN